MVKSYSSSLERLESSHVRLERKLTEIGKYVQKIGQGSTETPTISTNENEGFGTPLLNRALMKNAEIGQRRWSSIGVDEWIQAGRWWLLKVDDALLNPISSLTIHGLVPKRLIHERFVRKNALQAGLCRSC